MIPRLLADLRDQGTRISLEPDGRIVLTGTPITDWQRAVLKRDKDLALRVLGLDAGDLRPWQRYVRAQREGFE